MLPQNQKVLFLETKQGEFVVREHEVPKYGRGQLLVKIHSSALNPIDYKIQDTGHFIDEYPAILGEDLAGVVEAVGDGVQHFAKGDKVLSHASFGVGSFQQYAITEADLTAKIPPNLDFDQAATVPLGFDTAAVGLYSEKLGAGLTPPWEQGVRGKYAGKPILIMGGSSSVGSYVIQLAKLSGFSPIITTASLVHKDELKAFGATDVIDRRLAQDNLLEALQEITKQPIGIVYDAISLAETQKAAWSAVGQRGILVLTLQPIVKEEEGKSRTVVATYGNPHVETNRAMCCGAWNVLSKWLQDGTLKPENFEVLPNGLNGIAGGLARLKAGEISGKKLIAHPQETA